MKKIWVGLAICFLLGTITGLGYLRYLNHHPIKVYHYFPQLTRKIPLLKKLDYFFMATAGIDWYKVKHKKTGKEYLLKIGYDYWATGSSRWVPHYWVMDNIKRDKWIEFTQEQFQKTFGDASNGQAMQEVV